MSGIITRAVRAVVAPNALRLAATVARSSVARQRSHVAMASFLSVGGVGLSAGGLSAGVRPRRLASLTGSEIAGAAAVPPARGYAPFVAAVSSSAAFRQSAQPALRQGGGSRGMSAVAAQAVRGEGVVGLTVSGNAVLPSVSVSFDPSAAPLSLPSDLLLLAVFDSALSRDDTSAANFTGFVADAPGGAELSSLDSTLSGALAELASDPEFRAKPGQVSQVLRVPGQPFKRIALLGLGKTDVLIKGESGSWQGVGSAIATAAKTNQASKVSVAFVGKPEAAEGEEIKAGNAVRGIVTGAIVGSFEDVRFKSDEKEKAKAERGVKELVVVGLGEGAALERDVFVAERLAAGIILTKQLVNAPPNVLTPAVLADVAVNLTAAHSDVLTAKVLEKAECEQLGMGAYLAVAEASAADNPPKFIHVTYRPAAAEGAEEKPLKKLALVGKGLTFDSGGYNLKAGPGSMIHLMKFDMGGAAAVMGAAKAIAAIQPQGVEVHFIVAACENMVSGGGMKPGDIITASNGKTIEVNNTDAEGRLTLADALLYAQKQEVEKIVDIATLTGACIIALGNDIAGLFTPNDEIAAELEVVSKVCGDKVWRMPMEEGYWEGMRSKHADMVNTGGREGGSITAALFLKQFMDEKIPWAHLDIAGPVWSEKKGGGTGFAASLLYYWVDSHSS